LFADRCPFSVIYIVLRPRTGIGWLNTLTRWWGGGGGTHTCRSWAVASHRWAAALGAVVALVSGASSTCTRIGPGRFLLSLSLCGISRSPPPRSRDSGEGGPNRPRRGPTFVWCFFFRWSSPAADCCSQMPGDNPAGVTAAHGCITRSQSCIVAVGELLLSSPFISWAAAAGRHGGQVNC
jgi:hypothetical protein